MTSVVTRAPAGRRVATGTRPPVRPDRARLRRAELAAAGGAVALVLAAVLVARELATRDIKVYASAAPLFGEWLPHVGPGTPIAVAVALAVIVRGPALAQRLRWWWLLAAGYATAVSWTLALAMVDGWQRGLSGRLTDEHEYLHEVPGITDARAAVRGFTGRILDFQPDSWATHVAGHPPGALLSFVWLDRIGLGGGAAAAVVCVLAGASVVVSVPVAIRALGGGVATVRAAVPFLALFPGAVWVGASADGLFAGVVAAGIALLAVGAGGGRLAAPDRWRFDAAAVAGGLLLGFALYLSYGMVLVAIPVVAVALVTRRVRPLLVGGIGVLLVVAAFTAAGFWWLDGYHLVVDRYYQGIASQRPYGYWAWANLAALTLAAGPAAAAALTRLRAGDRALRYLVVAFVLVVVLADLSGLSKAETERIWLPFAVWLTAGAAMLHRPRYWLAGQAVVALAVNHLVLTHW